MVVSRLSVRARGIEKSYGDVDRIRFDGMGKL